MESGDRRTKVVMGSVDNLAKTDQNRYRKECKMVHDQNLLGIVSTNTATLAADIFHSLALYLLSNTVSNLHHDCREKDIF